MIYGYARCSTNEKKQDIDRQIKELKNAGAEKTIAEYEHGDAAYKEQLSLLLEAVKEGDTIIVLEVSRLARSTKQLCELIEKIQEKKLCLKILNSITIDCTKGEIDPVSRSFAQMAGVFSELELNMIGQRVKSGMANAKAKGSPIGRPKLTRESIPDVFYKHYPLYLSKSLNITELAKVCGVSRNTIYNYISLAK